MGERSKQLSAQVYRRCRWQTISIVTSNDKHTFCLAFVGWSVGTNSPVNEFVYYVGFHFPMPIHLYINRITVYVLLHVEKKARQNIDRLIKPMIKQL